MISSRASSTTFAMASKGPLLTRDQAAVARQEIESTLATFSAVEVDFRGVGAVSPSYADEMLGKLLDALGRERFKASVVIRCDDPDLKALINRVLASHVVRARSGAPTASQ